MTYIQADLMGAWFGIDTLSTRIAIGTIYRYRYLANRVELCADRERASATLPMSTAGMENSCDGVVELRFHGAALPCRFGAHFSCRVSIVIIYMSIAIRVLRVD